MAKIKKSYDCIIFGGGLSGLIAAKILSNKNKSFIIVEPADRLGGRLLGWTIDNQSLPSNLNLYSQNEHNLKYFNWLESTIDENILDGQYQTNTFHFQDGGFKSFNGFGDKAPQALEQLNKFCFESEKIRIKSYPADWISKLTSNLHEDHYLLNSEITKINFVDEKATSLEINGKTEVGFSQLIWAMAPQKLLDVVPHEMLGGTEAKKLKKHTNVFDAVILNLAHKGLNLSGDVKHDAKNEFKHEAKNDTKNQTTDGATFNKEVLEAITSDNSVFCLYGSSLDFEPIVGHMNLDHSCWMSLIDSEQALDHEHLTKVIKNMKRQIKRAFPTFFESSDFKEKIILSESSYGQLLLKENENGFLKSVPNLFCTSSLCSETSSGLLGTLDRTYRLDQSL